MKIDYNQTTSVSKGLDVEHMTLDVESQDKMFYILSQGLYKNPIRAIIQELVKKIFH